MKKDDFLFPYVLVRIASGALSEFEKLNLAQTITLLDTIVKIQIDINKIKEELSEELHTFISPVKDTKVRNTLIQLRRDIHNERVILFHTEFRKILSASLTKKINNYLLLSNKKHLLQKKGELLFEKERKKTKQLFFSLLNNPNFQKGILLSSNTLPASLKVYLQSKEKHLPKIERSLMRYLSRMYTKPSPFSTFTLLAYATFGETDLFIGDKNVKKISHIKLNHSLFHYIIGLLIQNNSVRKHLFLELNATIRIRDNQFVFLANNFNHESIQKINKTSEFQIIYSCMQRKKRWQYDELISQLLREQFPLVHKKEAIKYINDLLSYGFLEYSLGINGADGNWDTDLIKLISPLKKEFPYLNKLTKTLITLKKSAYLYAKANPNEREKILFDAFIQFRETCLLLHTAAGLPKKEQNSFKKAFSLLEEKEWKKMSKKDKLIKFKYETTFTLTPIRLWYEDYTHNGTFQISNDVKDTLNIFGNLLKRMGWFDENSKQLFYYANFFKKNYSDTERVDLLTFYEDLCKIEKNEKKRIIGDVKGSKKFLDIYYDKIKNKINDDLVLLSFSDISHIPNYDGHSSFSSYFHLMSSKTGKPLLIFNMTEPGFGQYYSRFLDLFSSELTDSLNKWNSSATKNALLAELTDASVFNANLHPPLMPYAVTSPGSYSAFPSKQTIPVTDIEVIYKKSDKRVHLMQKQTGKEIYCFDLGFQLKEYRSGFYAFLSEFTLGPQHNFKALIQLTNKKFSTKKRDGMVLLPRIMYENCIILQRKTWKIKKTMLPVRLPQENDWLYFQKMRNWKNELSLPDEVFVKIEDDKPQYINFDNQLLIALLEKCIENVREREILQIQEMLPSSNNLFAVHSEKHVVEFLAQWYY